MLINLDVAPTDSQFNFHYHADFIELLALAQDSDGIDRGSVYDRLNGNEDLVESCYEILQYREEAYADKYPFVLENRNIVKLKDPLSNIHRTYIFLLLCSCTSKVDQSHRLRSDFEFLCQRAFQLFLPGHASCHLIGKSSLSTRYIGHITKKLETLASDLKTVTKNLVGMFATTDTGDGGLDIAAWVPFVGDDQFEYMPLYFCQCATGRDWVNKQDEPRKIKNYLLLDDFSVVMFIPYDGRNSDGSWNEKSKIMVPLLFDRLRIINLLDDGNAINDLQCNITHVQPSIDYEEDYV